MVHTLLSLKLTCPLKNGAWKRILSFPLFKMVPFLGGMLIFGGVLERCSIDAFLPIPLISNVHPGTLGFRNIMLFLVPSRMGWFNYIINGFLLIAYVRVWNENGQA